MNMAKEWESSYIEWQRSPNQVFGYRLNLLSPGDKKCDISLVSDSKATNHSYFRNTSYLQLLLLQPFKVQPYIFPSPATSDSLSS